MPFESKEQLRNSRIKQIGLNGYVLEQVCLTGTLEDLTELIKKGSFINENKNIKSINDLKALEYACGNGYIDMASYLLTTSDLKIKADIHLDDDIALRAASEHGILEMVKFLLESPDLKEHANIHADGDLSFKVACYNEDKEMIEYFVFDYNITYTNEIKDFVKNAPEIKKMFDLRQLNEQLEKDLSKITKSKKEQKI